MKIFNEKHEEVLLESLDLEKGYLEHIPAQQFSYEEHIADKIKTYYIPTKIIFNDGSIYYCTDNDPAITVKDSENGIFEYNRTQEDIVAGRFVVGISTQKKTETVQENVKVPIVENVEYLQYREYTPAELENKQRQKEQQIFMSQGPAQMDTMQADIDTIILALAEVTGA